MTARCHDLVLEISGSSFEGQYHKRNSDHQTFPHIAPSTIPYGINNQPARTVMERVWDSLGRMVRLELHQSRCQ